jgi:hypothetical protein
VALCKYTMAIIEDFRRISDRIFGKAPPEILPPQPELEDFVNTEPNILVSVQKYGRVFYLGSKDVHMFDMRGERILCANLNFDFQLRALYSLAVIICT